MSPHERAYWNGPGEPSSVGLEQFRAFESRGERPVSADPDFTRLQSGKRAFNFARTEMILGWSKCDDRWPGTFYVESTSPAWIADLLLDWHPSRRVA